MFIALLITDQQFCQLYKKYRKYAVTVCVNVMRKYYAEYFSWEEVKDIIQETFLNTYLYLKRVDEVYNVKSLIARITELTTLKHMDRYARYAKEKIPVADISDDPIDVILTDENLDELTMLIKSLHPRYSSVLLLKNVHNMSLKQISKMTEISYNTILSWHHRGKLKLAKKLAFNNVKSNTT